MERNSLILIVTAVAITGALGWRARHAGGLDEGLVRSNAAMPRMVELGSDSCASCRAMIPVLEELREEHAGALEVEFIDVWKFPDEARAFQVRVIPTQVFLAPDGSELARHEGFYAADAIREQWGALGFSLEPSTRAP